MNQNLSKRATPRSKEARDGGWFFSVSGSLILHGSIIALLVFLVGQPKKTTVVRSEPSFVAARMVAVEPPPKPKPPPAPVVTPKPKPVAPPKPKPDEAAIALKRKQEEEKKRAEEQQRQQALKEKQEQEQKLAREKELERLKELREQRLRERQERERVQKQQEQERELQETLAREQQQAEQDAVDHDIATSYAGVVQRLVENRWTRPASARKGMQAILRIQLLPTGELISVQILTSSGDGAFDRSATQAVEQAAPFTELQGMAPHVFDKYFRTLRFVFNPEDLLE